MIPWKGTIVEQEIDALLHHHLARKGETDARPRRFRGEEGGEDFLGFLGRDRLAVVADVERVFLLRQRVVGTGASLLFPLKFNLRSARLLGVFNKVRQDLTEHILVRLDAL